MKATDYIAEFLEVQGVTQVFELVGGMITHLVDSLHNQGKIRIVSVHHEQAAAFAAEASARFSGIPGVALATSGPGATNLLTGIGSCYFDSTPAVFITGQVNRSEQKGDRVIRQLGFQETDIVAMVSPITKAAWRVGSAADLPAMLSEAFTLALSGRPGPVLLDIPMDVQNGQVNTDAPARRPASKEPSAQQAAVLDLLGALDTARRPLILAGGGIRSGRVVDPFRRWVDYLGVPVVHSLLAVDVLPYEHLLRVGMIGSYGNRWANTAIGHADVLIVVGSRLDVRQTGADTAGFKGERRIYHVDCDPGEMNNRIVGCVSLLSHLRPFLEAAITLSKDRHFPDRHEWRAEIEEWRRAWPDSDELRGIPGINPNRLMHRLAQVSRQATAFVVDVGQHQMWAAQSLELHADQRFLTSGGMGAMGFALPASIGAAFASDRQPVVLIAGDGGFQLNIQELQTVVRNQLPIKMVIVNNECHGMVRQFQQTYFNERYQSTFLGYSAPDFSAVAQAYGIESQTVTEAGELDMALAWLWSDPLKPILLQVMIDTYANAYPKMAFGLPITEMEPLAKPIAMEST